MDSTGSRDDTDATDVTHTTDATATAVAKRELRTQIRAQRAARAVPADVRDGCTGDRAADHADDRADDCADDCTHDRASRDRAILVHLLAELDRTDPGRTAGVAAFAPLPGEPGGPDLPAQVAATGRPVWLPVVDGPGRPLRWLPWRGTEATVTGAFGITEPVAGGADPVDTDEILTRVGALVIPALAVGPDGARLGQGGGFYDRTLGTAVSCGSGAPFRGTLMAIIDGEEFGVPVPATELDIRVPVVVTGAGVFQTGTVHGTP